MTKIAVFPPYEVGFDHLAALITQNAIKHKVENELRLLWSLFRLKNRINQGRKGHCKHNFFPTVVLDTITEYRVFCLPVALEEPQYLAERDKNVVKRKVISVNVTPEAVKLIHSGRDLCCRGFIDSGWELSLGKFLKNASLPCKLKRRLCPRKKMFQPYRGKQKPF